MSLTDHAPISAHDLDSLDRLFGQALLDDTICRRLVERKDEALLIQHRLSPAVRRWLIAFPAASLADLAQAVVARTLRPQPLPDNTILSIPPSGRAHQPPPPRGGR